MRKVLIVDDDKAVREYTKKFFLKRKTDVTTAESGEEALVALKKKKPDIVLLDINMGGIDGIETLKHIKSIDKNIKVIMVTVDEQRKAEAVTNGADGFLHKPLQPALLEDTVSLSLSQKFSETEGKK